MKYFVNVFVAPDTAVECPDKTSGDTIELQEAARMMAAEIATTLGLGNLATMNQEDLGLGDLATMDEDDLTMQPAANQVPAEAETVGALKTQFDALLAKLKAAGLMAADPPGGG